MKKNENGFSAVEILLVIVFVGLVGTIGWFVYDRQQKTDNQAATTPTTQTTTEEETEEEIDTTIHEVDIKLQTTADLSKLPDYTPASFKAYLEDLLKDNKYSYNSIDGVDTITEYHIDEISQVNIVGGQVPRDRDGDGHSGGAPAIWVLAPNGEWDKESLNGPLCESKNGGKVYEEFVKKCYTDEAAKNWVKNPNGSIKSLND